MLCVPSWNTQPDYYKNIYSNKSEQAGAKGLQAELFPEDALKVLLATRVTERKLRLPQSRE